MFPKMVVKVPFPNLGLGFVSDSRLRLVLETPCKNRHCSRVDDGIAKAGAGSQAEVWKRPDVEIRVIMFLHKQMTSYFDLFFVQRRKNSCFDP